MSVPTDSKPAGPVPWWWKLLLLLPALAHAIFLAWMVWPGPMPAEFGRVDLLVLLVVLAQVAGVLLVANSRRGALWYLAATYLVLAGLAVAEVAAARALPPSPSVLPRYPMRHQGVAAEGLGDLSGQTYTFTVNSLGLRGPEMDFHNAAVRILCAG